MIQYKILIKVNLPLIQFLNFFPNKFNQIKKTWKNIKFY